MDIASHSKSDTVYVFDICVERFLQGETSAVLITSTIETLLLMHHTAEAF